MFFDVTNINNINFNTHRAGWSTFIDKLCVVIQEQVNRDTSVNKEDMDPYDCDETPEECLSGVISLNQIIGTLGHLTPDYW